MLTILSIITGILIILYPRDMPYGGRDYVPGVIMPQQSEPVDRTSSLASSVGAPGEFKRKKMSIIIAKLSSSVRIDKENAGGVIFQLITKENGVFLTSTKVTY